ncbi:MAG: 23S rRNA (pseudouridine(1915)-N(3))-methyltransferase RlmH [Bacteroidetes bacterium]|nr:23S rRNA (pseudouridine(1915)-N(3))-methyltransferase RlmH [Bacteroidota bacterium]
MLKVKLLLIGKTSYPFLRDGENEYVKRLVHYCNFECFYLSDIKNGKSYTKEELKKKESQQFLNKIERTDFVVLLDETGNHKSSIEFAHWISERLQFSHQTLVFIIGGAYGVNKELYERAQLNLALSKMTFSHQMVRMIFLEQLYRAFTIEKGEKYHHI